METFTIIDVIRELGYEPQAPLSWEIGAAVRDAYAAKHGEPPLKALRPKTSGAGSHCFACYPSTFKVQASGIVADMLLEADAAVRAQGNLFGGTA